MNILKSIATDFEEIETYTSITFSKLLVFTVGPCQVNEIDGIKKLELGREFRDVKLFVSNSNSHNISHNIDSRIAIKDVNFSLKRKIFNSISKSSDHGFHRLRLRQRPHTFVPRSRSN